MTVIRFGEKGLLPAVVQDYETHELLMVAYMNKESLTLLFVGVERIKSAVKRVRQYLTALIMRFLCSVSMSIKDLN